MNIYFFVFACSLAGLLFGYDAGIISGALPYIKKEFSITAMQSGLIVSFMPLGALVGALIVGCLSDAIGRKLILVLAALLFIFGAFQCALADNVSSLLLGRVILGLAIGSSAALAPLYICEISLEKQRGLLVTLYLIAINLGILLAYMMNAFFMQMVTWRALMVMGVLPAMVLGCCAYLLPESPRWLMFNGREGSASSILIKLHGTEKAMAVIREINALMSSGEQKTLRLFDRRYLKILLVGILAGLMSQIVGINAIIYYAPTMLLEVGASHMMVSLVATVGIGLTYVISAVIASRLIDRVGRRRLLLCGLIGATLSLVLINWSFHHIDNAAWLGWLSIMGLVGFLLAQGMCLAPVSILIPAEILPLRLRGTGMGITIACNWMSNAVILFLFPVMMHHMGLSFSFLAFLVAAVLGFCLCYAFVPETKALSLEQLEQRMLSSANLPLFNSEARLPS